MKEPGGEQARGRTSQGANKPGANLPGTGGGQKNQRIRESRGILHYKVRQNTDD